MQRKNKIQNLLLLLFLIFLFNSKTLGQSINTLDSIEISKIWDSADYNSFTDLIRFNDKYYCSFREAATHVRHNDFGKIRIISSKDGNRWESIALLTIDSLDLRDPKLSITADKRISVNMAGAIFDEDIKAQKLISMVSFSDKKGKGFTVPEEIIINNKNWNNSSLNWIWRVTWQGKFGYGIDYKMKYDSLDQRDAELFLVRTKDGVHYQSVRQIENIKGFPNESTIRFNSTGEMFILVRRDAEDGLGYLARTKRPYKNFQLTKLDYKLGGPNFLFWNDKLIIGTRKYGETSASTVILITNLYGEILKSIDLPSGGDNSYPGLIMNKDYLWVSYYSSHEGKASIYLAKIPIERLKDQ